MFRFFCWSEKNSLEKMVAVLAIIGLALLLIGYLFPSLSAVFVGGLAFTPRILDSMLCPWTYLSYVFLHQSLTHLFMNLIILLFLCRRFWLSYGFRQFLSVFILGALFGSIGYQQSYLFLAFNLRAYPLMGCSSGVICLLYAQVFREPSRQIRVSDQFKFRLTNLAWFVLALILLTVLLDQDNNGGQIAHISSALAGILYAYWIKKGKNICRPIEKAVEFVVLNYRVIKTTFLYKKGNKKDDFIVDVEEKMRRSGYHSLEDKERKSLFIKK